MPVTADDVQRLFLQAVLSRRFLSESLARVIWAKCKEAVKAADDTLDIPHSGDRDEWETFTINVNRSLNSLNLELSMHLDEITGKEMYALVNRRGDELAQLGTDYTPVEMKFFKGIVEQIMLAPKEAYSVSSLLALREVSQLKLNITKSQAEAVLGSFVARGWLLKSKRGRYSLSSRSLIELKQYLHNTFPEQTRECFKCEQIITRGIACPTGDCQVRMHTHCFEKRRVLYDSCPKCRTEWPVDAKDGTLIPVGEDAARTRDEQRMTRQASTETESSEDELKEKDPPVPLKSKKRRSTRQKGKQKASQNDEMDVDSEEE